MVISDLPDPGITASTKLYSAEFYGLVRRVVAPGGRFVVHAGPPGKRPHSYWTVDASVRAGGMATRPYRVLGRRSGFASPDRVPGHTDAAEDWGFVLAAPGGAAPVLGLGPGTPALRSLDAERLAAAGRAAEGIRVPDRPPSTLLHPRYASET